MRTKYPRITLAGSAVAVAITALGLAGCGSNPGTITGHGTMAVDLNISGALGGGSSASDPFTDGTQVVVVNSSGTVIASTALHSTGGHKLDGMSFLFEDTYTFTVTVPGGLPRYGLQVGGTGHGTIWETPAEMTHPALSLDLT